MTTAKASSVQTESLHARIPQETIAALDHVARSIGRSRNWVFNEAVKQYLDVQRWQTELITKRLNEAKSSDATFISHDEIMRRHEKRLKKKLGV